MNPITRIATATAPAVRRVMAVRARIPVWGRDLSVALLLLGAAVVELRDTPSILGPPSARNWAEAAAMTLPYAMRRVTPVAAAAVMLAGATFAYLDSTQSFAWIAAAMILYSAVVYARQTWAWTVGGVVLALGVAAALRDLHAEGGSAVTAAWQLLPAVLPVVMGMGVRAQRTRAALEREHARTLVRMKEVDAANAVSHERMRITRELHDIVAHHVTGIVLQARAAERLLDTDPVQTRSAVAAVTQEALQALTQLRALVGTLRAADDSTELTPNPGVDDLPELVARAGRLGAQVDLHVEGSPFTLSPSAGLAVYRVTQEALTNVIRHAHPPEARVRLTYEDDGVRLVVEDAGREITNGTGHGVIGMRERIEAWGGTFRAGPGPAGGWCVDARLPVTAAEGGA